jgi:hypothetical protein
MNYLKTFEGVSIPRVLHLVVQIYLLHPLFLAHIVGIVSRISCLLDQDKVDYVPNRPHLSNKQIFQPVRKMKRYGFSPHLLSVNDLSGDELE